MEKQNEEKKTLSFPSFLRKTRRSEIKGTKKIMTK